MYEYYTDDIELCQLQNILSSKGQEGWRLHTCDINSKHEYVFIVMDRFINTNTESENNEQKDEAIACKG